MAIKKATASRVRSIPLESLIASPVQSSLRDRGVPALAVNMKTYGQLAPVVVTTAGASPGEYIIVDGHHRVAAAKLLGWSSVSCVVDGADCELAYSAANLNTQRFTDRHGFESWARSCDPDRFLDMCTRELFVRDVRLFVSIIGKKRAKEIALAGVASPSWARHARTVYRLFQERTAGEAGRNPQMKLKPKAAGITEAQILEWIIRQKGSNAAANLNKSLNLQKHLDRFADRILRNKPYPQRDWI